MGEVWPGSPDSRCGDSSSLGGYTIARTGSQVFYWKLKSSSVSLSNLLQTS